MFRLNYYAGLPVVAEGYENPFRDFRPQLEMVPTWNFPGAYVSVPLKKRLLEVFFHIRHGNVLVMSLRLEIILLFLAWLFFLATYQVFLYFSLFWYFWWADVILHTWGGAMIVMSWYTIARTRAFPRAMNISYNHPLLVLLVIMIGWEVYEYIFGMANSTNYLPDTILDFITGGLGGIIIFYLLKSRTIRNK